MGVDESQITGIQTDACSQYMQLTRATHETNVYLHDLPCGAPGNKMQVKDAPRLQTRLARMIHHRDVAGDYDWITVGCDKKNAPVPVCVKPEWPSTRALGTLECRGRSVDVGQSAYLDRRRFYQCAPQPPHKQVGD